MNHFYDGLWYDPAGRRTHDLPCERRTCYRLSQPDTENYYLIIVGFSCPHFSIYDIFYTLENTRSFNKKATHFKKLTRGRCCTDSTWPYFNRQIYKAACTTMRARLGRKERIISTHIQKLLNLSVPNICTVSILWKLNASLQAHICSLESLSITADRYGAIITPIILSRLPKDIRLEWSISRSSCRGRHHVLLCNPQAPGKFRSQNEAVPNNVFILMVIQM